MDSSINDILTELKAKYNITRYELERMIDCQYKLTRNTIENRELKTVYWIHLGKIRPTAWFKHNKEIVYAKKATRDNYRLLKLNIKKGEQDSDTVEGTDMQELPPQL